MTTVRERMSAKVDPIPVDTTLAEAAQRMRVSGVGGLPVLDPAGQCCAGILTERDIVIRVLAEGREPRSAIARDVATLEPVTCTPDEEIEAAIDRMREHEVQHLPVVEDGTVVGMLSLSDLVFRRPDEERGAIGPPREAQDAGSRATPTERAAAEEQSSPDSIENPAPPGDDAPTG